jgi:RNA polymerase sigma-70 factor (ECF subfamily)
MPTPARRPDPSASSAEHRDPEVERGWVASIAAGDETAFEALFHAYHAPLCAFVYRYVGARDLAEEIVQEVFLFVWERRETWDVRTSVKNYLFTAVRNAAVSYLRHEHVVRRREAETVDLFARPSPSTDSEARTAELAGAVQRAISRLPDRCRLVFTLHREQGLTYSEIAEVLEISPKTVEVQMGRALKSLRKALAGFWP